MTGGNWTGKDKMTAATTDEIIVGDETRDLLEHFAHTEEIDEVSKQVLVGEAVSILGKAVRGMSEADSATGLAVGYVQSGKTMSFTTLLALARDNGFRLVVVIAGSSIPLYDQSCERLRRDLQVEQRRQWAVFENPREADIINIRNVLADWNDDYVPPDRRQTVLVTVMKQWQHLQNLGTVISGLNLAGSGVLIVDDEADQAGMNTLARIDDESTTYGHIVALKQSLPRHAYIQYTATPQAPLLIAIIDALSPNFVRVLTPGADYAGGREFFIENQRLVRTIPAAAVPTPNNILQDPPATFVEALRVFFVGVAAYRMQGGRKHRSMLIHPSHRTDPHAQANNWVVAITQRWQDVLALLDGDGEKEALVQEFKSAYDDLTSTVEGPLPPFDELMLRLPSTIRQTRIPQPVNAARGATPIIDWASGSNYILVGGAALDRGYTVRGLTVTYMPRPAGVGNADTIQQRARFFGYKRPYLGYCRIYVESGVRDAYRAYVEHEEEMRAQLRAHGDRPLSEWKRRFFLAPALRPTRQNVLKIDFHRGIFTHSWFVPRAPHDTAQAIENNREVCAEFMERMQALTTPDTRHNVATDERHTFGIVGLTEIYQHLLTRISVTRLADAEKYTGALLQIDAFARDHEDASGTVYIMSGGRSRRRTADDDDQVQVHQGRTQSRQGYPGDKQFRGAGVTVQIHRLDIESGAAIITDVYAVALYLPRELGRHWLTQVANIEPETGFRH